MTAGRELHPAPKNYVANVFVLYLHKQKKRQNFDAFSNLERL